jgi:molecular chaperone DnaJ
MASIKRDFYEILSVERTASGDDIKRSYRKLAMKYHPDRNPGDPQAEISFKECAEAYEVLSDPERRGRYDQHGHEGLKETPGHDFRHMDPNDIFSMFGDIFEQMGGQRRQQRGGPARGYDLEYQVEVTLEDVFKGSSVDIEFTRQDTCPTCTGTGGKPGTKPTTCRTCGGQGRVAQGGLGGIFQMVSTCPHCAGRGSVYTDKCTDCRGTGRKPKRRVLNVKIPAGIHDGQAVRIQGEGEPGAQGGPRGDLHVVAKVKEHKLFERQDNHLILKMPISYAQAALGAKVKVPSLAGGELQVDIKPGTQHGDHVLLPGKGLPDIRNGRPGDMAVFTMIEVPHSLTPRQEELLRELAQIEHNEVSPKRKTFMGKMADYFKR